MPFIRLQRSIRDLGFKDAVFYALAKALAHLSGGRVQLVRYHLVAQPINAALLPVLRTPGQCVIRQVDAADPVCAAFPRPAEVIRERFARGYECFVAEQKGVFAGYLWLARGTYDEDEVRLRYELADPLQRLCVWDFDVYIEPSFRLGRTFARLWQAVNAHLASEGVNWSISRISAFNPASHAAHRRLGMQRLGSATFLLAGQHQLSFLGRWPYVSLSADKRSCPSLRLTAPPALAGSHPASRQDISTDPH